jgi:hypothetical protein
LLHVQVMQRLLLQHVQLQLLRLLLQMCKLYMILQCICVLLLLLACAHTVLLLQRLRACRLSVRRSVHAQKREQETQVSSTPCVNHSVCWTSTSPHRHTNSNMNTT